MTYNEIEFTIRLNEEGIKTINKRIIKKRSFEKAGICNLPSLKNPVDTFFVSINDIVCKL